MPWLEKRNPGGYRIVFRYNGGKLARSIKTDDQQLAQITLARFEDNLRRVKLGILSVPEDADVATFLLSDGKSSKRSRAPAVNLLQELCRKFLESIPNDALEPGTVGMLNIHVRHLTRILGSKFPFHQLNLADLQDYIDKRSRESSRRGKKINAVTIRKEIRTLSAIWRWAAKHEYVQRPFPQDGLRYPKTSQKPPFQTIEQIERRVTRGAKQDDDLWECLFLTLNHIDELLAHVKNVARCRFIYPMMTTAAHTGMRRSELLRSEIDDIDFESKTIMVREKKRVKGTLSMRTVPLSPHLLGVLSDWVADHPGGAYTFSFDVDARSKKNRNSFSSITPGESHYHLRTTLASSRWSVVRGWHVFRHSFCSNCAAKGIDQRIINAWVGHQTPEMVRRYRHLVPNQQQEAIRQAFS